MNLSILILALFSTFSLINCSNNTGEANDQTTKTISESDKICDDNCLAKNNSTNISCKLTSVELQNRKETVLESLRKQILEKKELRDGFGFKFNGSDKMMDELMEFIKTERACCDFFTFNLSISGDKSEIWLQLTGTKEAKDFIRTELEL